MITKEAAYNLVFQMVGGQADFLLDDDEILILEESTIEKDWGWVFFHTSKKWHETRDINYAIAGNSPIIVDKESGQLFPTGTAHPIEYYIKNYEETGSPQGNG